MVVSVVSEVVGICQAWSTLACLPMNGALRALRQPSLCFLASCWCLALQTFNGLPPPLRTCRSLPMRVLLPVRTWWLRT